MNLQEMRDDKVATAPRFFLTRIENAAAGMHSAVPMDYGAFARRASASITDQRFHALHLQ